MIQPQPPNYPEYEELYECARAHEQAVITEDEYKIKELFAHDKEVKYIVDIGANVGCAAFKFNTFYPKAKILVCEPQPNLMKFAKINTNDKLTYIQEAVIGDDRKEVTFNVCHWAGNGHVDGNFRWDLFAPMGSKKVDEIKVPACTLKDLVDRQKFPRIDLLKIDTEGMEGQILQAFKPYMKLVNHFRGEWHGDAEIPLIEDALKATHKVIFDRRYSTHGDVFAEPLDSDWTPDTQPEPVPGNPYGAREYLTLPNGKRQWILK